MRSADRVTAALLLAFAVAFSVGALKQYQWWGPGGPGSAFMPFWLGVVMALLALIQEAGRELGLDLTGIPTGGGSDGNHTSAVAPTIDGLGPVGGDDHGPAEWVDLASVVP